MGYGFSLVVRGRDATPETFVEVAHKAEANDLDALWLSAHVIVPPQVKSGYSLVPDLPHPPHWKEGYWEPFTICAYLAALTQRITLGTSVLVLPQHNPFEVAKQVAEIDQLSNGRFVLGIGVGWFEEEFEVLGQDFKTRGARTDDALRLMKQLWADDPVTYDGRFYRCENAYFAPKPVSKPHPPLMVAGGGKPAWRRAAEFADAFHPVRVQPDSIEMMAAEIAKQCERFGRPTNAVKMTVKLPMSFKDEAPSGDDFATQGRARDIVDGIKRYRDAGVEDFTFDVVPEARANLLETMERFVQDVRPHLES